MARPAGPGESESLTSIAGYEVMGTLGYGARSTIYAVMDKDGQVFALKRVLRESAQDERFLEQAVQEHEIASLFNHPSLRRSFKVIRHRGLLRTSEVLVVMELVDGTPLEHYKPASMLELCRLCRRAGKALAVMHEAGYVHADIKPNNIMVTGEDAVKIIDFGQSCPIGTIKQRIQGTPDYIAPEQVLRREITPQTDVFNLGATMYWLLTNRHVPTLLPKGGPESLVVKAEHTCKPPRELNAECPMALSNLVVACIETEPHKRPATMAQVIDRLELAIQQWVRDRSRPAGNSQPGGLPGAAPRRP